MDGSLLLFLIRLFLLPSVRLSVSSESPPWFNQLIYWASMPAVRVELFTGSVSSSERQPSTSIFDRLVGYVCKLKKGRFGGDARPFQAGVPSFGKPTTPFLFLNSGCSHPKDVVQEMMFPLATCKC